MSNKVKHIRTMQVQEDSELDISNWLSFRAELTGNAPVRIGSTKRLVFVEDVYCRDSDGIPYAPNTKLKIQFDQTADSTKLLTIEYEVLECCD
jgi:hypothetical protein